MSIAQTSQEDTASGVPTAQKSTNGAALVAVANAVSGVASDSGTHAYVYLNGLLSTDTWVNATGTYIKTYAYTNGALSSESDWVKQ